MGPYSMLETSAFRSVILMNLVLIFLDLRHVQYPTLTHMVAFKYSVFSTYVDVSVSSLMSMSVPVFHTY